MGVSVKAPRTPTKAQVEQAKLRRDLFAANHADERCHPELLCGTDARAKDRHEDPPWTGKQI